MEVVWQDGGKEQIYLAIILCRQIADLLGIMEERNEFTSLYCGGRLAHLLDTDGGKERGYLAILRRWAG